MSLPACGRQTKSIAVARQNQSKPGDSSLHSEQAPQSHEIKHLRNTRLLLSALNTMRCRAPLTMTTLGTFYEANLDKLSKKQKY